MARVVSKDCFLTTGPLKRNPHYKELAILGQRVPGRGSSQTLTRLKDMKWTQLVSMEHKEVKVREKVGPDHLPGTGSHGRAG